MEIVKAMAVGGKWVCGELVKIGNVCAVIDWDSRQIAQIFGNTICYEVGHKLSGEDKPTIYEKDLYEDGKIKVAIIDVVDNKIVTRIIGRQGKKKEYSVEEFKSIKSLKRNLVGKAYIKGEKYNDDTISRLFDVEMARIIHNAFLHTANNDNTIEGACASGFNLLPMGNRKFGKLIWFSPHGCFSMSRSVLLQFTNELCNICNTYFNPRNKFTFSIFETEKPPSNFEKLS